MPIITRRTKNLSPLEEDSVQVERGGPVMDEVSASTRRDIDRALDGSDRQMFVDIGTTILMARCCATVPSGKQQSAEGDRSSHSQPGSLQECEIFQPIRPQNLALMKAEMERLWDQGVPVVIEVKGQNVSSCEASPPDYLLLEQWTLQVVPKNPLCENDPIQWPVQKYTASSVSQCPHYPVQYLHQAVASFLHFSQIRSWMVASDSPLPFQLLFRVCAPGEDEEQFTVHQPDRHCFPLAVVCEHSTLTVTVRCLPRLEHIPFTLVGGKDRGTTKHKDSDPEWMVKTQQTKCPAMTRRVYSSIPDPSMDDLSKRTAGLHITPSFSELSSGTSPHRSKQATPPSVTKATDPGHLSPNFPFSPPQPSPLSPKLLSGLADVLPYSTLQEPRQLEEPTKPQRDKSDKSCSHPQSFCFDSGCALHQPVFRQDHPNEGAPSLKNNHRRGSTFPQRAASCSYPSGVCPPSASSPIPYARKAANEKRRSLAINIKRPMRPPVRSNSAPSVVPSLYLLGTFEESVLNGRLEPCGYVDGFTAELGASGSFCPRHITLPVTASFFSLAEHGGTSPYLGQIDLSTVGKRGYRIPKTGTVQVTLLNPNKMVVKIYFVKYDFSDMPPNTQTFLRHKTLSRPYLGASVQAPVLHYLIHLRFLCSKSDHLYLHRNIRLIFARRAPDTDPDLSQVSLFYTTEGPTDPKYGPIHSH